MPSPFRTVTPQGTRHWEQLVPGYHTLAQRTKEPQQQELAVFMWLWKLGPHVIRPLADVLDRSHEHEQGQVETYPKDEAGRCSIDARRWSG